jgi:hypothetical protein
VDDEYNRVRTAMRDHMRELLTGEPAAKSVARKSTTPIQIATFEC